MNNFSIRNTNISGDMRLITDPSNSDTPSNMEAIPRYMGWRLIRKGPDTMNEDGFSSGLTVVLLFLNVISVHRFSTIPKITGMIPRYKYGGRMKVQEENKKCDAMDKSNNKKK